MRLFKLFTVLLIVFSSTTAAKAESGFVDGQVERWFYLINSGYSGETPLEACETAFGLLHKKVVDIWEVDETRFQCQHLNYAGNLGAISNASLACSKQNGAPYTWLWGACDEADDTLGNPPIFNGAFQ